MFFSAQKNKCCSLDFHQDHNIYYRATILLRPTLHINVKKKGFQQSAIIAESLETSDFKPFRSYYLSLRDIKTTVSTCVLIDK